jgi:hypothetical protein
VIPAYLTRITSRTLALLALAVAIALMLVAISASAASTAHASTSYSKYTAGGKTVSGKPSRRR